MDNLKDLKSIADEIMSDINVSEDLKRRTLAQCKKKRYNSAVKVLIPAACLLLSFIFLNVSGIMPLKNEPAREDNTEMNLLADKSQDAAENAESAPESSVNSLMMDNAKVKTRTLSTIEEARKIFGSGFLTPKYIPEHYSLEEIQATGTDESNTDRITLTYQFENNILFIIEEKSDLQEELTGYKEITVHGTKGYITSLQADDKTGLSSPYTDIHWYKEGIHYNISGQITEEEAVNISDGMSEQ